MSNDPVERYNQLSPATRKWLEIPRRQEDFDTLDAAIKFYSKAQTNGRFLLWLIGSMFGLFVGVVLFGDSVLKAIGWFKRP